MRRKSRTVRSKGRVTGRSERSRDLVATVRKNVTDDWALRENVRARLRVLVTRILRKYGDPPDRQERAPQTASEQAALAARCRNPTITIPSGPDGGH